jgi:hypothetical protein
MSCGQALTHPPILLDKSLTRRSTIIKTCLIGHTGFVGSTLLRQTSFSHCYNSKNFGDMSKQHFDLVVCAGVSSLKWVANQDPQADWAQIQELIDVLATIQTNRFVLISTVDVYPVDLLKADEGAQLSDSDKIIPYGKNRLRLEQWVASYFVDHCIVRLPGLFGAGLRKNPLYDLIHNNGIEKINPASVLQWYPMHRLWQDMEIARKAGLQSINLFTQPVSMRELIAQQFPGAEVGPESIPAPTYDFCTRHADLFGGNKGYIMDSVRVLEEIKTFVDAEKGVALKSA